MADLRYQRVLLKLSGESLAKDHHGGIEAEATLKVAGQVKDLVALGVQVAIVVGGGNILRGGLASRGGMNRLSADHMGMLGTVINAMALEDALETLGVPARVQSAIEMPRVVESVVIRRAVAHLAKGRVVIFGGGTGNPFFTTDTTAALRACEVQAQALLKATKVDGVYSADPKKVPTAVRFPRLTFTEAIEKRLEVMDAAAFSLCREHRIPIVVFNFGQRGAMTRVVTGDESVCSVVTE